ERIVRGDGGRDDVVGLDVLHVGVVPEPPDRLLRGEPGPEFPVLRAAVEDVALRGVELRAEARALARAGAALELDEDLAGNVGEVEAPRPALLRPGARARVAARGRGARRDADPHGEE